MKQQRSVFPPQMIDDCIGWNGVTEQGLHDASAAHLLRSSIVYEIKGSSLSFSYNKTRKMI